jgi:hypothetical protein
MTYAYNAFSEQLTTYFSSFNSFKLLKICSKAKNSLIMSFSSIVIRKHDNKHEISTDIKKKQNII